MKRIDGLPGIALGDGVSPWLQTPAADALIAAQRARGATIRINSALRALPAQYVLYRWYRQGKCGITLAASPGQSNHESGLAIDINDSAAWRPALQGQGFRWLGPSDVPHYDFRGDGTVNLAGLSVLAFQRLWNRNHPEDRIDEDSAYGPQTAARLERAPVGGFATGASTVCPPGADDDADVPTDAGAPPSDGAPEPDTDDELPSPSEGCASSGRAPSSHFGAVPFAVAAVAMLRRRRARRGPTA